MDNHIFTKITLNFLIARVNKEFWILGIHPLPLCPKSKIKKLIYYL